MNTQNAQRKLTWTRILRTLQLAVIALAGATKFRIVGRGNPYVREDGTAIHIFNVAAFRSPEDAKEAAESYKQGKKLELAGDVDGAHEHFRAALNKMMSFSVLAQNASDYQGAFEVACIVELVENQKGEKVLGINQPRPVAVQAQGASAANLFEDDEEEIVEETPATKAKAKGAKVK
jgi:hypothetical protein